jgi:hypothetical protein
MIASELDANDASHLWEGHDEFHAVESYPLARKKSVKTERSAR